MKIRDILVEGDVIKTKFMTKLGQKKGMYYHPEIEIPEHPYYNYVSFFTKPTKPGSDWSNIFAVTDDGEEIKLSTAPHKLAEVLAGIYNTGGWTDVKIERVPLSSAFKGKDEE
jgi:hypothetical protein